MNRTDAFVLLHRARYVVSRGTVRTGETNKAEFETALNDAQFEHIRLASSRVYKLETQN